MVNKRTSKQRTPSEKGPAGPTPLRKQVQELELLLGISRQIATIETLDELLAAIVDISARETASER
jgi:hypothetical protein